MSMGTAMGTLRDPEKNFVPVADRADLDRLFAKSAEQPVVLFKHDFSCRISAYAYRELTTVPNEVPLIDVERQKGLAAEVASRTGIEHQSPQVIVLRNGRPVHTASHWDIAGGQVTRAAAGAALPGPLAPRASS